MPRPRRGHKPIIPEVHLLTLRPFFDPFQSKSVPAQDFHAAFGERLCPE
jgi:hypothetical protein